MEKNMSTMHAKNLQQVSAGARITGAFVKTGTYVFLIIMAIIVLFPFYWMIISSLKTEAEYRATVPTFWPQKIMLGNYAQAFRDGPTLEDGTQCLPAQVAVLEEDGFVQRLPSEADKRVMELYPTQKTLELLPQISEILMCWENCLTQDLTEEEKENLSTLMRKMSLRATRYMEDK